MGNAWKKRSKSWEKASPSSSRRGSVKPRITSSGSSSGCMVAVAYAIMVLAALTGALMLLL